MKTFKLRTGNNKIHTIRKDIFEYETQQQPPYYVYGEKMNYHSTLYVLPVITKFK